jgi:hypothetical protein
MKKFEYKEIRKDSGIGNNYLNSLGNKGWGVIHTIYDYDVNRIVYVLLKREIETDYDDCDATEIDLY